MSGTYLADRNGQAAKDRTIIPVQSLGKGTRLLKTRRVNFDHAYATKLLQDLKELDGDRPLRQHHVDYLVGTMNRGTFRPELVKLVICRFNGDLYRLNGQHTSWARLEMPPDWPCQVEVLEYEADTMDDLRILYASIDRGAPRGKGQVINAYLKGTEEYDEVAAATLKVLPAGYQMFRWQSESEQRRHDGDDIAYLLRTDDYDLAMRVCGFLDQLKDKEHKHLFRAPVVAALFLTFQKVPTIAPEFWREVADGMNFTGTDDPRKRLRDYLLQTAVGAGRGAASYKKKEAREPMLRACIVAWNYWRENKGLKVLKQQPASGRRPAVH